ncbi:MAG: ammonia-forming cytochrome c nitrite reductase subunit c552 [Methanobacteriota archaeon]|nr:MAG: ammonia-forming cytochrome c nitrite reductase subunit c552 [Euryarchaeota archaeon]
MKRITIALAMTAVGVAIGLIVFGFGINTGGAEGTRGSTDNSYMDTATYVGSSSCSGCHSDEHTAWAGSLHSKMIQDPLPTTVIGDFTLDPILNDTTNNVPDVTIDLNYDGGTGEYTATMDGTSFLVDQTVGSAWKQRYLTQIGGSLYFLPIQWNVETNEWVAYHLERWFDTGGSLITQPSDLSSSWNRNCAGCHTTGLDMTFDGGTGEWQGTWTEFNIGCESCHGPGSDHMGNTDYIWLSVDAQICGQCHIRGTSNGTMGGETLGYPWSATQGNYMPGDTLAEFYTPGEGLWADGNTSKKHHQQYRDWLTSGHSMDAPSYAQNAGCMSCRSTEGFIAQLEGETITDVGNLTWQQTCASCHTTHDTTNEHQLRLPEDQLCGECHTVGDSSVGRTPHHAQQEFIDGYINVTGLSGTPWMNGDVTCVDCHMPETAKSAVAYDISSHTFRFIGPEEKTLYGLPNACTDGCHDGVNGFLMTDAQTEASLHDNEANIEHLMEQAHTNMTLAEEAIIEAFDLAFTDTIIEQAQDLLEHANYTHHFVEAGIGTSHNPSFAEDLLLYANDKANEAIALLQPDTMTGTLVDYNQDPIPNAQIRIDDTTWDTTDSNGDFDIAIAPGSHTFSVWVGGEELGDFTATSPSSGQTYTIGEAPPEPPAETDNLWLYLIIIIIVIVVVIAGVGVALSRRGGALPPEEELGEPSEPLEETETE